MKSLSKIVMVIALLLSAVNIFAQSSNIETITVKISDSDRVNDSIEKARKLKNISGVECKKDTKMAAKTYNRDKTGEDEILKSIDLADYDSEKKLATVDVCAKVPGCCQLNKELKPGAKSNLAGMDMKTEYSNCSEMAQKNSTESQDAPQLKAVIDRYFSVKDALIKSDGNISSAKAAELVKTIKAVEMSKLSRQEQTVWMKTIKALTANGQEIASLKDVAEQRKTFALLSKNMYELAKITKQETPVYYQHCPIYNNGKGANWLSKEEVVKNPYYGSQMLTCGNIQETIK